MKLSIVTPAGGTVAEAVKTIRSVHKVAAVHSDVTFEHIVVLNNGLRPFMNDQQEGRYHLRFLDLNPLANRSRARNAGIDVIAHDSDFVLFLDAGDILLPEAIKALEAGSDEVFCFAAIVKGKNIITLRKAHNIRVGEIVNPFYIGATWVPSCLARRHKFPDGRKEDWKYWITLKRAGARFKLLPEINYVYNVTSALNHSIRKASLIRNQFDFFRNFLGHGILISGVLLLLHYAYHFYWWNIRILRQYLFTKETAKLLDIYRTNQEVSPLDEMTDSVQRK